MFFRILAHIKASHLVFVSENQLRNRFAEFCLPNSRRANEKEHASRFGGMDLFGDVNKVQFRSNQGRDHFLNDLILSLDTLSQAFGCMHKRFCADFLPCVFAFTKSKVINQRLELLFVQAQLFLAAEFRQAQHVAS